MVERLVAQPGSADEDFKLLADLGLSHIFVEQLGPQRTLDHLLVGRRRRARQHPLVRRSGKVVGLYAHALGPMITLATGP